MSADPDWVRLALWAARPYTRDRQDAEDVRQEALLGALRSVRKIEARGGCAVNRAAVLGARWAASQYVRRQPGGSRCYLPDTVPFEELSAEPGGGEFAGRVVEEQWRSQFRQLLARTLNEEQQDVVRGLYWRRESTDQIAARRGCSPQRVERTLARARARLREVIEQ